MGFDGAAHQGEGLKNAAGVLEAIGETQLAASGFGQIAAGWTQYSPGM